MSTDEHNEADHDPDLAKQFETLDRMVAPDLYRPGSTQAVASTEPPTRSGQRHVLVAVAAGILIIGAGIAYVATTAADRQDVETATGPSAAADTSSPTSSITTVDAPPNTAADGTGLAPATLPSPTSETATSQTAPSSTATSDTETSGIETSDSSTSDGSTVPSMPESTTSIVEAGTTVTVDGIVTEVFTDCGSWLVLNESGSVEEKGPISCDGGSFVVVDGTRIRTSAGFVPPDVLYYDKHPADLRPGATATVLAIADDSGLTLGCNPCGITVTSEG